MVCLRFRKRGNRVLEGRISAGISGYLMVPVTRTSVDNSYRWPHNGEEQCSGGRERVHMGNVGLSQSAGREACCELGPERDCACLHAGTSKNQDWRLA